MTETHPLYFTVYCLDAPNAAKRRDATTHAHRQYMKAYHDKVFMGGPLMSDDGQTRIGSIMTLAMDTRNEVDTFMAQEPYHLAGVFETVLIRRMACFVRP